MDTDRSRYSEQIWPLMVNARPSANVPDGRIACRSVNVDPLKPSSVSTGFAEGSSVRSLSSEASDVGSAGVISSVVVGEDSAGAVSPGASDTGSSGAGGVVSSGEVSPGAAGTSSSGTGGVVSSCAVFGGSTREPKASAVLP